MLIEMPRRSPRRADQATDETRNAFEAGLRRDLNGAPVVCYDPVLGGWIKRAIDIAAIILLSPIWTLALAFAMAGARMRHKDMAIIARESVGYGGRIFKCYTLRLQRPTARIERLHLRKDQPPEQKVEAEQVATSGLTPLLERLPLLVNVVRGDMALVGPQPLGVDALEQLKGARRHYLSARPGLVGIAAVGGAEVETPEHYKLYALSWSVTTDALLLWDAVAAAFGKKTPPTTA